MHWISEPPTIPGWYFAVPTDKSPADFVRRRLLLIRKADTPPRLVAGSVDVEYLEARWYGPLSEPVEELVILFDECSELRGAAEFALGRLENPLLNTELFDDVKDRLRRALAPF